MFSPDERQLNSIYKISNLVLFKYLCDFKTQGKNELSHNKNCYRNKLRDPQKFLHRPRICGQVI